MRDVYRREQKGQRERRKQSRGESAELQPGLSQVSTLQRQKSVGNCGRRTAAAIVLKSPIRREGKKGANRSEPPRVSYCTCLSQGQTTGSVSGPVAAPIKE